MLISEMMKGVELAERQRRGRSQGVRVFESADMEDVLTK